MEIWFSVAVGIATACGIFLMLRAHTFTLVLGLTLLSYAVNLFLFASGGLTIDSATILGDETITSDPLPQALVLTAIVIGFAMTAFACIQAMRARSDSGNDHVDGKEQLDVSSKTEAS
ncbi:Na+/H+ antiporter subunit C [Psychromonas sp. KJ10-10]|uniref:Na+/H+ antiporter subunit C n=1 Tax=Psychromonas sp. KJ10-10 TaxID=3391823 RepID=UPI0039B461B8